MTKNNSNISKNILLSSTIEQVTEEILIQLVKKHIIAYDEAKYQFTSSTTYQLIPTILLSISEETYAKIATLILKIYQKEQEIDDTLKSIYFKQQQLEKLEILKEYALQNEPSIEVDSLYSSKPSYQRVKKK